MHCFRNILYVTLKPGDQSFALNEALRIAQRNETSLKVLAIFPEFPGELKPFQEKFKQSVLDQLEASVKESCDSPEMDPGKISYEVEFGKTPGLRMVRQVLRHDFGLMIKDAEPHEGGKGFQAVDMELLRKCPCPVWLCRPPRANREDSKLAVAIDPDSSAPAGEGLALKLLEVASSLAERLTQDLNIISCWDSEFEETLRSNVWYRIPEDALQHTVANIFARHRNALRSLIQQAALEEKFRLHHLHGQPDELIPSFVERKGIDILVMGTVARVGIPGFLIGNTAENVLQKVSCSLLVVKPEGFVCPVKMEA